MSAELSRRFKVTEPLILACDCVNPASESFLDFDVMLSLANAYSYFGIDTNKLKAQAMVAKNMLQATAKPCTPISDVLKATDSMKAAFPGDLLIVVELAMTIPVSSAGAERSFSTMRWVKTFLRSSMTDSRLSNLCLLSIERGLSGQLMLDPSPVVDAFAAMSK